MSEYSPLVSIGLPVFNGAQHLEECLESLLSQTYRNIEIVICDNASTDRTRQICERYSQSDSRVVYHRNETNLGAVTNFRRVLTLSHGPFFMWQAADDFRPGDAVASCLDPLLKNESAVMAHGPILVDVPGHTERLTVENNVILTQPQAAERVRSFDTSIRHNAIIFGLYRSDALRQALYPQTSGPELILSLQMLMLGPFVSTKAPMLVYRERRLKPVSGPVYEVQPLNLHSILRGNHVIRKKCWQVLVYGSYRMLRMTRTSRAERIRAVLSHFAAFGRRYRSRLCREFAFVLCLPLTWLGQWIWSVAKLSTSSSRVARHCKQRLGV